MSSYRCKTCDGLHDGPPLSYASPAPEAFFGVPEQERERRCELSSDQCIIDAEFFFVLGNVRLPIIGRDKSFAWTVWASLSEANFDRASELWNSDGRESEPPYFGWLSTSLPGYPETLHLKTDVHTQPLGVRPEIQLEPTEHPLAVEQRDGITWERVEEIAALVLHGEGGQQAGRA